MLSRWVVDLRGPVGNISLTTPHAIAAGWLDPAGQHAVSPKSWAVSRPQVHEQGIRLSLRLLNGTTIRLLTGAVRTAAPVRVGSRHLRIAGPAQCTRQVAWPPEDGEIPATWTVEFTTPTTFRHRNRTSPWPAPESLLQSLITRLPAIGCPEAAARLCEVVTPALRDRSALWVSDVRGTTEVLKFRDHIVAGFVGEIRYQSDASPEQRRALDALFLLAEFSGIGSHTPFGLGEVEVRRGR